MAEIPELLSERALERRSGIHRRHLRWLRRRALLAPDFEAGGKPLFRPERVREARELAARFKP